MPGNAPYPIGIQFVAPDNAVTTGSTSVVVKNASPVVTTITGPTSIMPGQPFTLTAAFTDAGVLDTHTAVWNWGDNTSTPATIVEANGSGTATASHVYASTGPYTATVTVTDDDGASGTGTFLVTVSQFIYVLDPSASGAFTASGNAAVKLPGAVLIDSKSSTALLASGNAKITAPSIGIVGGYSKTGNASFSVSPFTGLTPFTDPLAGLLAPNPTALGLTNKGAVNLSGNSSLTISQGIYTQINVSGNAHLTMNPGIYVIQGGGFTVTGNASVIGNGVMIYNAGSNFPSSGGTFGGITLSGNGTITLSPPSTGPYDGVVIFQSHQNTRALSFSGNASAGVTGDVYAANALLSLSGNTNLKAPLVVGTVNVSGNVSLTQLASGTDGGDTTGIANTLLAGNLSVYVNDPDHYFTTDELARIQDAINGWDALLVPYSVTITEVSDPSVANLVLDAGTTSASGGMAQGVLGCFNPAASEITLIEGWNWYAGADPTQIGSGQYDFQTTVTHEFGHALGLGGNANPDSPMYELLPTGTARRTMTVPDLDIPYPPQGADPLTAAGYRPDESKPSGSSELLGLGSIADVQNVVPGAATSFTVVQHNDLSPGGDQAGAAIRLDALDAALSAELLGRSAFERAGNVLLGVAESDPSRSPSLVNGNSIADTWESDVLKVWNDRSDRLFGDGLLVPADSSDSWRTGPGDGDDLGTARSESQADNFLETGDGAAPLGSESGTIDPAVASPTATLDSAFAALGFFSVASGFGSVGRHASPILRSNVPTRDSATCDPEPETQGSTSFRSWWRLLWSRCRRSAR